MEIIAEKIGGLESYLPNLTRQADHFEYWDAALALYREVELEVNRTPVATPISEFVDVYDIVYNGFDGARVHGWFMVPKGRVNVPALVTYPGYTGGRGLAEDHVVWAAAGFAVLAVDARLQGGSTGSNCPLSHGTVKGWVTQGILSPETSYYRFLLGDAYRAVSCLAQQPEVDYNRIGVVGSSQGGGMALWTALLHDKVQVCVANVPNLCHLDKAILSSTGSITEAAEFLQRFPEHIETVFKTLSYFDVMNSAERLSKPTMVSVGLKDTVCLPETIYAAYNRMPGPKEMAVYPFAGHSVSAVQRRKALYFLQKHLTS